MSEKQVARIRGRFDDKLDEALHGAPNDGLRRVLFRCRRQKTVKLVEVSGERVQLALKKRSVARSRHGK